MEKRLVQSKDGIISGYEILNGKIYIHYLDGKTSVQSCTNENIKNINFEMLDQAIKIVNQYYEPGFSADRKIASLRNIILTSAVALSIGVGSMHYLSNNGLMDNYYLGTFVTCGFVSLTAFITFIIELKKNIKNDKDIKKYDMYINNFKMFNDNKYDNSIYEGTKKDKYTCADLAHIDAYSFEEFKKVYENIKSKSRKKNVA